MDDRHNSATRINSLGFMNYFRFIRQQYALLGFASLLTFLGNYGQTFFIALFGGEIRAEFNLSNADYGAYYSIATLTSSVLLFKVGGWIDRYNFKSLAIINSLILALSCLLLGFSYWIWMLVLAFVLLRLSGQGLMTQISITHVAKAYHANRGKALSIVSMGMSFGEAILPGIAAVLIATLGWRYAWAGIGLSIPIIFIPLLLILYAKTGPGSGDKPETSNSADDASAKTKQKSWSRSEVLRDPRFLMSVPAIIAPAMVLTGIFFHQVYIVEAKAWSLTEFASSFLAYGAAHVLGSLVSGPLTDKIGVRKLLPFFLLPFALGLGLFAAVDNFWVAPVFFLLAGLTVGIAGPVSGCLWPEVYGTEHLGAIRSMIVTAAIFSTAVAPALFGWLLDVGVSANLLITGCAIYVLIGSLINAVAYTGVYKVKSSH